MKVFVPLTQLKIIHMSNNNLKTIDTSLVFPNITDIYLSNNDLTSFDSLENFPNLEKLDLSGNKLNVIPTNLSPHMKLLDISNLHAEKNIITISRFNFTRYIHI